MEPVAHIRSDFSSKFGVPRQAGLVEELRAIVVFEPPCRMAEALRGIEGFSHLWLIWEFSENRDRGWSPTVRPPRLGGNKRMGVFATRSPFRPNPIGLSCVRLEGVEWDTPEGPVLHVSGADLVNGTPILDVKPYIPYADCHPEAAGALPPARRRALWRWSALQSCSRRFQRDAGRRCWGCWARIPGPPTRTTRGGCTVSDLLGWRCASPSGRVC